MKYSNLTVTAMLTMFIGLLANIGGAATTVTTAAPYLRPFIPLLGIGGVVFCSLWLFINFLSYLSRVSDEKVAEEKGERDRFTGTCTQQTKLGRCLFLPRVLLQKIR